MLAIGCRSNSLFNFFSLVRVWSLSPFLSLCLGINTNCYGQCIGEPYNRVIQMQGIQFICSLCTGLLYSLYNTKWHI